MKFGDCWAAKISIRPVIRYASSSRAASSSHEIYFFFFFLKSRRAGESLTDSDGDIIARPIHNIFFFLRMNGYYVLKYNIWKLVNAHVKADQWRSRSRRTAQVMRKSFWIVLQADRDAHIIFLFLFFCVCVKIDALVDDRN